MRYLIIDGALNGTGIRDRYEGGYIEPEDLSLSFTTINRLKEWLGKYEKEHYNGFINQDTVSNLDKEGKEIALIIKNQLSEVKMEYYSHARLTKESI